MKGFTCTASFPPLKCKILALVPGCRCYSLQDCGYFLLSLMVFQTGKQGWNICDLIATSIEITEQRIGSCLWNVIDSWLRNWNLCKIFVRKIQDYRSFFYEGGMKNSKMAEAAEQCPCTMPRPMYFWMWHFRSWQYTLHSSTSAPFACFCFILGTNGRPLCRCQLEREQNQSFPPVFKWHKPHMFTAGWAVTVALVCSTMSTSASL